MCILTRYKFSRREFTSQNVFLELVVRGWAVQITTDHNNQLLIFRKSFH